MQLSQTAQKLLTRGHTLQEELTDMALPMPAPRLRLVEKPAKCAAQPCIRINKRAAEAAARVAAHFAQLPAYKTLGAFETDENRAPVNGPGSLHSLTTAVQTLANKEGRRTMSTSLMPATEACIAQEPLNGELKQPIQPSRMEVRLSIFEIDPYEQQPQMMAVEAAVELPALTAAEPVEAAALEAAVEQTGLTMEMESAPRVAAVEHCAHRRATPTAPVNRRLMASFFDLSLLAFVVAAALVVMAHSFPLQLQGGSATALAVKVAMAGLLVYRALFAVLLRVTPGQIFAGVRVMSRDGKRAGRLRLALRQLIMALSMMPVGLGFVWALFDGESRGWHDRLSGTYAQAD